jgi:KilA-N domain
MANSPQLIAMQLERTMKKVNVLGTEIAVYQREESDFISLTDMVKNSEGGSAVIENWLRNKNTIEFLGIWEEIYNPAFNSLEFEGIKNMAGLNRFVLSVKRWVEKTGAIGVVARTGRYGGTFAHRDIAFEFASWISPQFKLYLLKEFQRLKEDERKSLDWDVRRNLAKINYRIHTDAIKTNLIPAAVTRDQAAQTYASEADVLNVALFGMTARQWRDANPGTKGNIRDQANGAQLVCLSNMESLNAEFIKQGLSQMERLKKLNAVAIQQMRILVNDVDIKRLKGK